MKNRRNIVEQQNPPQNPNDIWLKDGKFYRSTSEGWTIVDSEFEYTNKEAMTADNPKGGTIGIDKESGEPSIYNDVTKQWSPLGGGVTETTWQELKDKRDAGKLTPGALYRITDYQCTTTQENTRSAGHQFDIVLLALSENKLAEEGWAMMHENDTYFANSNLSAWKVWYCLDNDKSRFAWADDSVDEGEPAFITTIGGKGEIHTWYRYSAGDSNNLFAWNEDGGSPHYTASQTPSAGDTMYYDNGTDSGLTVNSFTPAHKGTGPNGRGVIYRLIDEWNNDCPYDFKNIQYVRKLTNGLVDANGQSNYVYTFSLYDIPNDKFLDASMNYKYHNDEGGIYKYGNNKIYPIFSYNIDVEPFFEDGVNRFKLNNTVITVTAEDYDYMQTTSNNIIFCSFGSSFPQMNNCLILKTKNKVYNQNNFVNAIISDNAKVVWETIS